MKVEYDRHFRDTIGDKTLNSIAQHHLISLYASLLSSGLKPATLECLNICIKPSFTTKQGNVITGFKLVRVIIVWRTTEIMKKSAQ